ncbi:hypothetical protein [uncultured Rikenella sp.]|uniref:hypothetical protein n=1 Tax=uncultured Rikenella sp. TaxID=368003 RepID=UPI0026315DC3|nr:hypothetical protein [uncultured Rikenella sp.]
MNANRAGTNGALFLRFFEPPALSPSGEAAQGVGDSPNPRALGGEWVRCSCDL